MKRTLLLCLFLCAIWVFPGLAEGVSPGALPYTQSEFEQHLGYALDEDSGDWIVGADAFARLLEDAQRMGASKYCVMQVALMGNIKTGLMQPVLDIRYIGSQEVLAGAVSILLDGVRYDLAAYTEEAKLGNKCTERTLVPLPESALGLARDIHRAERFHVLLIGAKRSYSTEITASYSGSNERKKLESRSAQCLGTLSELRFPDRMGYSLWDLNAERWLARYEVAPGMEWEDTEGAKGFGLLKPGDRGKEVRSLQERLIALNFLSGKPDGVYGAGTREAVLRAQKQFGLLASGGAGRKLAECLERGRGVGEIGGDGDTKGDAKSLGNLAEIRFDRHWVAGAVMPARGADMDTAYEASTRDNVLFILDGEMTNTGQRELAVDWQMTGTLDLDGYAYQAVFLLERDEGRAFGSTLLPQGRARLVAAAEIPKRAAEAMSGRFTVRLEDSSCEFELLFEVEEKPVGE